MQVGVAERIWTAPLSEDLCEEREVRESFEKHALRQGLSAEEASDSAGVLIDGQEDDATDWERRTSELVCAVVAEDSRCESRAQYLGSASMDVSDWDLIDAGGNAVAPEDAGGEVGAAELPLEGQLLQEEVADPAAALSSARSGGEPAPKEPRPEATAGGQPQTRGARLISPSRSLGMSYASAERESGLCTSAGRATGFQGSMISSGKNSDWTAPIQTSTIPYVELAGQRASLAWPETSRATQDPEPELAQVELEAAPVDELDADLEEFS